MKKTKEILKPTTTVIQGGRERTSFGTKTDEYIPNLLDVQLESWNDFIKYGFRNVLRESGTIRDLNNKKFVLRLLDYRFTEDKPVFTEQECFRKDQTYAKKIQIKAQLVTMDDDGRNVIDAKEKWVDFGQLPIMTERGTFIISGKERTVVSQLVRSPGVFFGIEKDNGKETLYGEVNPKRGVWMQFRISSDGLFTAIIDPKSKKNGSSKGIPINNFIQALSYIGLAGDDITDTKHIRFDTYSSITDFFGDTSVISDTASRDDHYKEVSAFESLRKTYEKICPGDPFDANSAAKKLNDILTDPARYNLSKVGRYKYNKKLGLAERLTGCLLAEDVIDGDGVVLAGARDYVTKDMAKAIAQAGVQSVTVRLKNGETLRIISNGMVDPRPYLPMFTEEELEELRLDEMLDYKTLVGILDSCGTDKDKIRENLVTFEDVLLPKVVTVNDLLATINYMICLRNGIGSLDDIDHLGNRRILRCGELFADKLREGLGKMSKNTRDLFSQKNENDKYEVETFIKEKPVMSTIREFVGTSQLSQLLDQNNPLCELMRKRRITACGPGGLVRERAGTNVRDVHYTHYGRMCPIETPEGQNVGLVTHYSSYAKVNKYGFIETPYRIVENGKVKFGKTPEEDKNYIVYLTADEEDECYIAQSNEKLTKDGSFVNQKITVRSRDAFASVAPEEVDYVDISPKMLFSVATSMIPFLENDDANRALMGANMQQQANPLIVAEAPLVATGIEYKVGLDSGDLKIAEKSGEVTYVDALKIIVHADDGTDQVYNLTKFTGTNAKTCKNQIPIVRVHQMVKKGDVLADGPSTDHGEVSLGKNALIAFTTWEGYNYEDAVLINEDLVNRDVYTSINIEKFECVARRAKNGDEKFTREIPNVGESATKNLGDDGIIRIGAEVREGDILVGKITPKGEEKLEPEFSIIAATLDNKASSYKDTSLRVPHGGYGTIIGVDVRERDSKGSDGKSDKELDHDIIKQVRITIAQKRKLQVGDKMAGRHGNKGVVSRVLPREDMPYLEDGTPLDIVLNPLGVPSRMNIGQVLEVNLGYAARKLGIRYSTPVFDGAHEADIREQLKKAGIDEDGKSVLYDGRTGRKFENRVTVGVMYYLKLHHLVDDKIHARSTGPYSLVTQQPLGGKAQMGGQRFGEMEVWALEAYGAAYTLQEILTIKSDSIQGRNNCNIAISNGQNITEFGIPDSFKVLIKELKALALDIKIHNAEGEEVFLDDLPADVEAKAKEVAEKRGIKSNPDQALNIADIEGIADDDDDEDAEIGDEYEIAIDDDDDGLVLLTDDDDDEDEDDDTSDDDEDGLVILTDDDDDDDDEDNDNE